MVEVFSKRPPGPTFEGSVENGSGDGEGSEGTATDGSSPQPRPLRGDDLRIDGMLTWTVDGKQIDVGPGQDCAFRAARFTASTTTPATT